MKAEFKQVSVAPDKIAETLEALSKERWEYVDAIPAKANVTLVVSRSPGIL